MAYVFLLAAVTLGYAGGVGAVLAAFGWLGCVVAKVPVDGPLWRDPGVLMPQTLACRMMARLWKPSAWLLVGASGAALAGAALYAAGLT